MKVGRQMVQKLITKLSSHRRSCISVELRESNLTSHLFFRDAGFRASRVLHEHFADTGEDAYLMQYRMPADVVLASVEESVANLDH
jgi:ribosomal-protein-alanine N-acetyltransferase